MLAGRIASPVDSGRYEISGIAHKERGRETDKERAREWGEREKEREKEKVR